MTNKKTKKELLAEIMDIDEVAENQEYLNFLAHEIELLDKKAGGNKKPTARQAENIELKKVIYDGLEAADRPMTIKEMQGEIVEIAEITNQRIARLLTDLRNDHKVKRTYVKKVPYYEIGDEAEVETATED